MWVVAVLAADGSCVSPLLQAVAGPAMVVALTHFDFSVRFSGAAGRIEGAVALARDPKDSGRCG
jgi:hypothetical protein